MISDRIIISHLPVYLMFLWANIIHFEYFEYEICTSYCKPLMQTVGSIRLRGSKSEPRNNVTAESIQSQRSRLVEFVYPPLTPSTLGSHYYGRVFATTTSSMQARRSDSLCTLKSLFHSRHWFHSVLLPVSSAPPVLACTSLNTIPTTERLDILALKQSSISLAERELHFVYNWQPTRYGLDLWDKQMMERDRRLTGSLRGQSVRDPPYISRQHETNAN